MFVGTLDVERSFQLDNYSCGARSVYMITRFFGIDHSYAAVKAGVGCTTEGTNVRPMIDFFREVGLRVRPMPDMGLRDMRKVFEQGGLVLAHVDGDHFIVVNGLSNKTVYLADPSPVRTFGRSIPKKKFQKRWGYWGIAVFPPKRAA